ASLIFGQPWSAAYLDETHEVKMKQAFEDSELTLRVFDDFVKVCKWREAEPLKPLQLDGLSQYFTPLDSSLNIRIETP
ncbi:MAG: hypothetical protein AAF740_14910, partial [Bacteroidota bacterium]